MKNDEKIFDLRKRVSLREVFTTYDDLADREFLFWGCANLKLLRE